MELEPLNLNLNPILVTGLLSDTIRSPSLAMGVKAVGINFNWLGCTNIKDSLTEHTRTVTRVALLPN